jgi:hypothetical protein
LVKASAWVRVVDDNHAERLATTWFEAMVTNLPAGYWDEVLAGEVYLPPYRVDDPTDPIGAPLTPCGYITSDGPRGGKKQMVSPTTWPPRWKGLGTSVLSMALVLLELDSRGASSPSRRVQGYVEREIDPSDESRPWLRLGAHSEWWTRTGAEPIQRRRWAGWQNHWGIDVLRTFANTVACEFAMVTTANQMVFQDSREKAWLPFAQEVLPTYEWVTVASSGVIKRLGGVDALHASGAFWRVEAMAAGSAWLQATEDAAEFVGPRVDAVFDALVQCLPGRPVPRPAVKEWEVPYAAYGRSGAGYDPMAG